MNKFPSIDQYRHAVRRMRDLRSFDPSQPRVIPYRGTVKLHGTNAGITQQNGELTYLSRNRVLKLGDDNAGFVAAMSEPARQNHIWHIFDDVRSHCGVSVDVPVQLFGEWCGQGIQKGVAVAQLPKMFVIFAIRVGEKWINVEGLDELSHLPDVGIYSITRFPTFHVDIDIDKPELAQNQMVAITEAVEAECPVAKAFGVSGIGEGVVWAPASRLMKDSQLWFKVKGEKHSVTKVAKLVEVDVERFRKRDDLVNAIATDNRCQQGIDHLVGEMGKTLEMRNIGDYLRWVFNDVIKEEADRIEASGFDQKELGKPISDVAKRYFMRALDNAAMREAA